MDDLIDVDAEALRLALRRANMSARQVAVYSGVSARMVQHLAAGTRPRSTRAVLGMIAKTLRVNVENIALPVRQVRT